MAIGIKNLRSKQNRFDSRLKTFLKLEMPDRYKVVKVGTMLT